MADWNKANVLMSLASWNLGGALIGYQESGSDYLSGDERVFSSVNELIEAARVCEYCGEPYRKGRHGDYCKQCYGPRNETNQR